MAREKMGEMANGEKKFGFGSTRSWIVGSLAAVALLFGAPVAAQAAEGVNFNNVNNSSANGGTLDFGSTTQLNLPVEQTVFFWTNQNSGGLFNSGRRHVAVGISWNNDAYVYDRQAGGTGTRNCGTNSATATSIRLVMNYTGTGYKSCGFVFRLKAGIADNATYNATMSFTPAASGSGGGGCTGPSSGTANCAAPSSGTVNPGSATWTGTVVANVSTSAFELADSGDEITSYDFGEIGIGSFAEASFRLRNTGNTNITTANAVSLVGPDAGEFTQTNNCPATLAPAATCVIDVTYTPTVAGAKDATLRIASGSRGDLDLPLDGSATLPTFIPVVQDTDGENDLTEYTFTTPIPVGEPFFPTYTLTLRNIGNSLLQGVGNQALSGTDANDFTRSTDCSAPLGPQETCTITVGFDPNDVGEKAAVLEVDTTNGGSYNVNLFGTAIQDIRTTAILDTTAQNELTEYSFPDTVATGTSAYTFTIRNTGNVNLLAVNTSAFSGDDADQFASTTSCGASLAPNATCTYTVNYNPTRVEDGMVASLDVTPTNGGSSSVGLKGNAPVPSPAFEIRNTAGTAALTSRSFGTVNIGSSGSYTFQIANTGDARLSTVAGNQTVTGRNSGQFTRTTNCPGNLAVGATCTVTITFSPTGRTGFREALLSMSPTNPVVTPQGKTVDLSGEAGGLIIRNDQNDSFTVDHQTKRWMDTVTVGGAAATGDRVRTAFVVDIGRTQEVEDVLVSNSSVTNDTPPAAGTFNPVPSGLGRVEIRRRPGSSQALVITEVPMTAVFGAGPSPYGMSGGFLDLCIGDTFKTNNRRVSFRLRGADGTLSPIVTSRIRYGDTSGLCGTGIPLPYDQEITEVNDEPVTNKLFNRTVSRTDSVTFGFKGYSQDQYSGINWRVRNADSGAMFTRTSAGGWDACTTPCVGDGNFSVANGSRIEYGNRPSGSEFEMTVPNWPSRGRWIVEATSYGSNSDRNYPAQLGSVLVNDNEPQINVTGLPPERPDTNSNWTLNATVSDPSDPGTTFNPQAGVGQTIEWDLNNDQTDGPGGDGFEISADGDATSGIDAEDLTQAFTTAGKTPGPFTIRARVTDNGAILSNDGAARSTTFSRTFTINSPPEAITENFDVEADDPQGSKVEFRADDADGDSYKVTVSPAGGNDGELTGPLATDFDDNDISYEWPAEYTGSDEFDFFAEDDKKGVGPTGTLTVRVRPNTTIDEADPVGVNPAPGSNFLGATRDTEAAFEFSSPQSPVVEYECRLTNDGEVVEDWTGCADGSTGDTSYDGLEDGLHRFEVRAVNDEGVADGTPAFRTWRVDNTAPVALVREGPRSDQPDVQPRPTNDDTPSYIFEADDRSPQEFVTYECRVLFGSESGNWKECGSPSNEQGSSLVDLVGDDPGFGLDGPLADGIYEIEVRATDDVGIQGGATLERFRIDTVPPTTSIATGPDGLINTRDVEFQATSTEAGSTFACELVGEQQGVIFEDALCPGGAVPVFEDLADDEYELRITAIDPATNRDTEPPVAEFEVDATEPTTDLNTVDFGDGPTNDRLTQSRRVTVGFQGEDPRTTKSSRLRGFECRLDSESDEDWGTCESPETYGGLTDGEHVLEIRALDDAGNSDSSPQVVEWNIDRTPPTTTITDHPDPVTNDDRPEVSFGVNEEAVSECQLDGGPWVACDSPVDTGALNADQALADGFHTLSVRSTDGAGNLELTPASIAWEQDTVVPQITMLGVPPAFTPLGEVEFGWTVKDGNPPVLAPEAASQCAFDPEDAEDIQEEEWEDCDREYTVSREANSNGDHAFFLRAVDSAGNMSEMVERTWTVLGTKPVEPVIDNSIPADGTTTRLTTASIAFSHPLEGDESLDGLHCQLDGGSEFPCSDQYTAEGLTDGEHTFSIIARDTVGNESDPVVLSWTVASRAPVTTINSGPSGLTRQRGATITFSSDRVGSFECRVDGAPWAECASPLELADLSDGPHSVRVRAVTSAQPVGVKDPTPPVRQWTVDATAPEASIDSAPTGSIFNNAQATATFSTDDPTATFQCKFNDGPFQTCTSPLDVSGRPNGEVQLRVRAVDPAGNLSEIAEADWLVVNPPPEVCPEGFEGTPPNCSPIPPPTSDRFEAELTGGSVSLGGLGDAEIPGGDLKLTGQLASDGTWTVPQNGVRFNAIQQVVPDALGPGLDAEVQILIQATGPGTGRLQPGGGSANFTLPVQARLAASLNGTPLINFEDDCALRPVLFDLAGTYDEGAKKVSLTSPSVSFPQVSAGCGGLGGTINTLLELPRNDIAVTLNFDVRQVADATPARLTAPKVTAPKSVRSGSSVTLRSQLRNTGGTAARNVKVCLKSPTSLVKGKASRCQTTTIAAGASRSISFKVQTKSGRKGKRARFEISAEYTAAGKKVITRTGHVTLMK